jgi:hypothetical protein
MTKTIKSDHFDNVLKALDLKVSDLVGNSSLQTAVFRLSQQTPTLSPLNFGMVNECFQKMSTLDQLALLEALQRRNPTLAEHYGIDSNKGYGAKKHIDGIKQHGITIWHRKSFGICKNY